ncbi:hypothetical protein O1W71_14980 [Microbacterium sp. H37-C3]|uniref:hypothetical protein n=1 Tax=Microbacterium sp. H37-C3 TaxID=3004354 RepID=UPI0022AEF77D|nr:hypothetical protein [Microbacterium sp. H37-C3]MCZ4068981.1 hypothetical protein [Microbacterium sp. H37-C3]
MTDITTTAPVALGEGTMVLPAAPVVTDRRAGFSGELDRARNELAAAQRTIAERDEVIAARNLTIEALRTEQITDGGDYRLTEFWERAGRIADHASFCEEYDRMAEAMNGPRRERDFDVTLRITVEWTTGRRAVDGETAGGDALDDFDVTEIAEEARMGALTVIETEVYDTEES